MPTTRLPPATGLLDDVLLLLEDELFFLLPPQAAATIAIIASTAASRSTLLCFGRGIDCITPCLPLVGCLSEHTQIAALECVTLSTDFVPCVTIREHRASPEP